jgi:hypothetical protein
VKNVLGNKDLFGSLFDQVLCYVMLCYVMFCFVMLCYVMLCFVMLCFVMLCYVMLCYVIDLMADGEKTMSKAVSYE